MTLREQRLAAGLTLKQLAQILGCRIDHLSLVERGHRNPSPAMVRLYAGLRLKV